MTDKVIDIRSRKPHMEGKCKCLNCKHEWFGVGEIGTEPEALECPNCGTCKGVWFGVAFPDRPIWQCKCGCMHFFISGYYAHCCHCGLGHEPWKPMDDSHG